ncbi:Endoribonuclease L-PSP [Rhodopseudomonas palustris BisB5]|uniref:Endoribonuclease L-PSP n=1 Tax=Rhodopseudomonas palustris (strain BisB5) TaxID=316057 RepID=Q133S8_RHOPS|nr:Endoribonuclease L-PSP [Rhodopseudomonas palustris BisB5]
MPIQHFAPPAHIQAPPLSFAARTGDLLFISGIPGYDDNRQLPDDFEAQFGFVVVNITRVLTEAGASLRDLVKLNVLLTRAADVAPMNKLYAQGVRPGALPRTHHLRGPGAARPEDADRNRRHRVAGEVSGRRSSRQRRDCALGARVRDSGARSPRALDFQTRSSRGSGRLAVDAGANRSHADRLFRPF